MQSNDKDLIRALKGGSVKAYEALFTRYQALIRRFVMSLVQDVPAAEDLTQEVFMTLWSKRAHFDENLPIRSWLYVTSRNKALNYLKRALHNQPVMEDAPAADNPLQDRILDFKRAISSLEGEMAAMPPRQREVFRMSRIEGKSREEIATELGIAIRTVDKHLEVAARTIRKHFNYDA